MIGRRSNQPAAVALAFLAVTLIACSDVEPVGSPTPLLVAAGAGPISGLRVLDAEDEVLWAVEADEPRPVEEVFYGLVPEGFRQITPAGGEPPRLFDPGESLRTLTRTERRLFVHRGFASGFERFTIVDSRMELLERSGSD